MYVSERMSSSWTCKRCGGLNYVHRTTCHLCGAKKPRDMY